MKGKECHFQFQGLFFFYDLSYQGVFFNTYFLCTCGMKNCHANLSTVFPLSVSRCNCQSVLTNIHLLRSYLKANNLCGLIGRSIWLFFFFLSPFETFNITWRLCYSFYKLPGIWALLGNCCFRVKNPPPPLQGSKLAGKQNLTPCYLCNINHYSLCMSGYLPGYLWNFCCCCSPN